MTIRTTPGETPMKPAGPRTARPTVHDAEDRRAAGRLGPQSPTRPREGTPPAARPRPIAGRHPKSGGGGTQ
jgi:hypothetical protein